MELGVRAVGEEDAYKKKGKPHGFAGGEVEDRTYVRIRKDMWRSISFK